MHNQVHVDLYFFGSNSTISFVISYQMCIVIILQNIASCYILHHIKNRWCGLVWFHEWDQLRRPSSAGKQVPGKRVSCFRPYR